MPKKPFGLASQSLLISSVHISSMGSHSSYEIICLKVFNVFLRWFVFCLLIFLEDFLITSLYNLFIFLSKNLHLIIFSAHFLMCIEVVKKCTCEIFAIKLPGIDKIK